jgi:hypothetical protein
MAHHVDQLHPRIQAVDPQTGQITPFFFKWLVAMWERSGGPDDAVAAIELIDDLLEKGSKISELEKRLEDLELQLALLTNTKETDDDKRYALMIS